MSKKDVAGWLEVGIDIGIGVGTGYGWSVLAPNIIVRVVGAVITAFFVYFAVWIPINTIQRKTGHWLFPTETPTAYLIVLLVYVILPAIIAAVLF